jgi:maltose-binding protein MalE
VKYILRTGLILLIMAMLAGCTWFQQITGNGTSPEPMPTVTASPTPFAEATPTREFPPAPRHLTLKLWVPEFLDPYNASVGGTALTSQLNDFSANNDRVQVEVVAKLDTGPGGLLNLLSTAVDVAPSILPDVIVLNKADLQSAVNAGLVQPLQGVTVTWSLYCGR